MTRPAFLRRLRAAEDRAAKWASRDTLEEADLSRALELMQDGPLTWLCEGMGAGRIPDPLKGPEVLALLGLGGGEEGSPQGWAFAYLSGADLPPLPEDAALYFADRAADLEDLTRGMEGGEEKTGLEDRAAVWATLEALALALEEKRGKA